MRETSVAARVNSEGSTQPLFSRRVRPPRRGESQTAASAAIPTAAAAATHRTVGTAPPGSARSAATPMQIAASDGSQCSLFAVVERLELRASRFELCKSVLCISQLLAVLGDHVGRRLRDKPRAIEQVGETLDFRARSIRFGLEPLDLVLQVYDPFYRNECLHTTGHNYDRASRSFG